MTPYEFGYAVGTLSLEKSAAAGKPSLWSRLAGMVSPSSALPPSQAAQAVLKAPRPKLDLATAPVSILGPLAAGRGVPVPASRATELSDYLFKQQLPPIRPPSHRLRMPSPDGYVRRFGDTASEAYAMRGATRRVVDAAKATGRAIAGGSPLMHDMPFGTAAPTATTWGQLQGLARGAGKLGK